MNDVAKSAVNLSRFCVGRPSGNEKRLDFTQMSSWQYAFSANYLSGTYSSERGGYTHHLKQNDNSYSGKCVVKFLRYVTKEPTTSWPKRRWLRRQVPPGIGNFFQGRWMRVVSRYLKWRMEGGQESRRSKAYSGKRKREKDSLPFQLQQTGFCFGEPFVIRRYEGQDTPLSFPLSKVWASPNSIKYE